MKTLKIEIPKGHEIDKEKSTFENIVFKPINTKYVDLGLPSGTLWAETNEDGDYSYQKAIDTFSKNNLPKLTDFAELYDYCTWKWDDKSKSMIVTGPNGKYIILPASGYRNLYDGKLEYVGYAGNYWSVSPNSHLAYYLNFHYSGYVNPASTSNCVYGYAVRKIKRK